MQTRYSYVWFVLIGILFAVWFGGFTFYAAVVVPIGTELIGTSEQGIVTQTVSNWLNGLGGITLVGLAWLSFAVFSNSWLQRLWGLLLLTWLGLLGIHPILDTLIETATYEIQDPLRFYFWHRIYLWIHTLQWFASIAFVGVLAAHVLLKRK